MGPRIACVWLVAVAGACGSTATTKGSGGTSGSGPGAGSGEPSSDEDDMIAYARTAGGGAESEFGPLEVGADFPQFRRVTPAPFLSLVHGNRWVHVYVTPSAADAYVGTGEIPVGTTIVKASWIDAGGRASSTPGPIYVMQKRAAGYAPEHGDWYYAIHWAKPTGKFASMGPFYWRGASPRVEFCYDCHDAYDRSLGGLVPSSLLPR